MIRDLYKSISYYDTNYTQLEIRLCKNLSYDSYVWPYGVSAVGDVVVFAGDNGGIGVGKVVRMTSYGHLELELPHRHGYYLAPVNPCALLRRASPLEQLAAQL